MGFRQKKCIGIVFLCVYSQSVFATGLSANMSEDEVRNSASILALGSAHRTWTAHSIVDSALGLELGLETSFIPRRNILEQGNGEAVVPKIIPVPRVWVSWALPRNFYISGSVAPASMIGGISAYGFAAQWTFSRDMDTDVNSSVAFSYTYSNAFGDLSSHTTGLSLQASKDLLTWQPYGGVGFLVSNATVRQSLVAANQDPGPHTLPAFNIFIGIRIDLLAKLSLQMDMLNTRANFSLLMAKSF